MMMGSSNKTIVWFRRDLRIEDNPALAAAAKNGRVLPVYIWCPNEEGQFYPGRVSRWWLKQSLAHLQHSLKSLGAELLLMKTESTYSALLACINATGAATIVFNRLYDPISVVRDHCLKQNLAELGIYVETYNADLLYEPWEVYNENGLAYTTFDAYWDRCLQMQIEPASSLPPWKLVPAEGSVTKCQVEDLGLEDESEKSSNDLLSRAWSPGWSNANNALAEFVEHHLHTYSKNRLEVGVSSTSLLSPYLHFGELSVRKIFHLVRMKQIQWIREGNSVAEESVSLYLRAIGLREYARHICFNFPFTSERPLMSHLNFLPWNASEADFKAWRQGRTGYPLVDAGMRELWATGWIHNKIRVIVSSFAVKVLLLPWKWGMKYFWDTLLDADLENDILGWQYISGSLPDGHELDRLDSPQIQGSKFDPEGEYVRLWLPEIARLPTEWIHHPWEAPSSVLKASGVELGTNYPNPIIDLDLARQNLTEAKFKMWELEATLKAANPMTETVVDNVVEIENQNIPRMVTKEKASPCSSIDQRVPSFGNFGVSKKRMKDLEEEKILPEVWSAAESSSGKKQSLSWTSFAVPQHYATSKDHVFSGKRQSSQQGDSEREESETSMMEGDYAKTERKEKEWRIKGNFGGEYITRKRKKRKEMRRRGRKEKKQRAKQRGTTEEKEKKLANHGR